MKERGINASNLQPRLIDIYQVLIYNINSIYKVQPSTKMRELQRLAIFVLLKIIEKMALSIQEAIARAKQV